MNSANVIGPWSRIAPRIASATCSLMARSMPPSTPGRIRAWSTNSDSRHRCRRARRRGWARAAGDRAQPVQPVPARLRGVPRRRHRRGRRRAGCRVVRHRGRDLACVRHPRALRGDGARRDRRRHGADRQLGSAQSGRDGAALARPAPRDRALDRSRGGAGPVRRALLRGRRGSTAWSRPPTARRRRPRGGPPRRNCSPSTMPARGSSTGRRTSR